ncbi:MAG: hypothetical protein ACRDGV_02190, partial [Candidatus Limnocylindria bacterium]
SAPDMSPAARSQPAAAAPEPAPVPAEGEASPEFLHELVAAMRRVADEARQSNVAQLRERSEEQVKQLQTASEQRAADLRQRAEADVAGIGDWAKSEAERIRAEAEKRVAARRTQLDEQLAGETKRSEEEAAALRARLSAYERDLDAYHAQLIEITDPAAFAAAAKRIPRPPQIGATGDGPAAAVATGTTPATPAEPSAPTNGVTTEAAASDADEPTDEKLAGRLAELDSQLDEPASRGTRTSAEAESPPASSAEATSIVVKGLGSFGAITGFRQSLAAAEGIDAVSLSLGPTGEFVYRASHASGFDVAAAIARLEGDAAKVEPGPDGSLQVTLSRQR